MMPENTSKSVLSQIVAILVIIGVLSSSLLYVFGTGALAQSADVKSTKALSMATTNEKEIVELQHSNNVFRQNQLYISEALEAIAEATGAKIPVKKPFDP